MRGCAWVGGGGERTGLRAYSRCSKCPYCGVSEVVFVDGPAPTVWATFSWCCSYFASEFWIESLGSRTPGPMPYPPFSCLFNRAQSFRFGLLSGEYAVSEEDIMTMLS